MPAAHGIGWARRPKFAKAEILLAQEHFEEAIVEAERSLALNPSFVSAYSALCIASSFLGGPQQAIDYADKAIRLSPRDPILYAFYLEKGFALSLLHQDDQAIGWLRRAGAAAPQWPLPQALLAAELSLTGREAEAHLFLAYAARLVDGLRRAGLPE